MYVVLLSISPNVPVMPAPNDWRGKQYVIGQYAPRHLCIVSSVIRFIES